MSDFSDGAKVIADEIEQLPATGTVDAAYVHELLGKMLQSNTALSKELERVNSESIKERIEDMTLIDRQIDLIRLALKKIESLRQQNAELLFDSIGVVGGPH